MGFVQSNCINLNDLPYLLVFSFKSVQEFETAPKMQSERQIKTS